MSGPSHVEPAEPLLSAPASDSLMFRSPRPRGFTQQVTAALLQPGYFFRTLFAGERLSRGWLGAAVLILVLVGIAAVPSQTGTSATPDGLPVGPAGGPPAVLEGGGGPASPGSAPVDGGGGPTTGASASDVADAWTTALLAASGFVVAWIAVSFLLIMAPLFNGRPADYARALQVAVWASLPFAVMGVLRLIYVAAGGEPGKPGISGLLDDWKGYADLPVFVQSLLLSLTEHLTLFWLWNLFLLGLGARLALGGRRWIAAIIVILWAVLLVVTPVALGVTRAPEPGQPGEVLLPEGPSGGPSDAPPLEGQDGLPGGVPVQPRGNLLQPRPGGSGGVNIDVAPGN